MAHPEKNPDPETIAVFQIIQARVLAETAERSAALIALGGDPDSGDTFAQQCEVLRAGLLLAVAHLRIAESLIEREEFSKLKQAADTFTHELTTLVKKNGTKKNGAKS